MSCVVGCNLFGENMANLNSRLSVVSFLVVNDRSYLIYNLKVHIYLQKFGFNKIKLQMVILGFKFSLVFQYLFLRS